jgi:hypothetical protein
MVALALFRAIRNAQNDPVIARARYLYFGDAQQSSGLTRTELISEELKVFCPFPDCHETPKCSDHAKQSSDRLVRVRLAKGKRPKQAE